MMTHPTDAIPTIRPTPAAPCLAAARPAIRGALPAFALVAAMMPGMALAHAGHDTGSPFAGGLMHPLGGADHLLAMVAVGLWAGAAGGRALWAMPLTFVAAMLAGGGLGAAHVHLPLVEPLILASAIILGAAVALSLRPALTLMLPPVALFGLMHGYAHGAEGPGTGLAAYAAGFALATAALHLGGIALARLGPAATRALGAGAAMAGVLLAVLP